MSYFITASILFLNLFFAFGKRQSKLLALFTVALIWILFGWNTDNSDYESYNQLYNEISIGKNSFLSDSSEYGFRIIMEAASLLGFDYNTFIITVSLFGLFLLSITIIKNSKNINYVYILYFIYPFFLDVVQVRNFLAMSIIVYAVNFLLIDSKQSRITFVLLVFFATSIHYAAILYLPIVLINKTENRNLKILIKASAVILLLLCMFIFVNGNTLPYIGDLVYESLKSEKVSAWFDSHTRFGFILFWSTHLMSFGMLHLSRKIMITINNSHTSDLANNNNGILNSSTCLKFTNLVYYINIYSFAFFPLYMLASTFTRLMRNLYLLYFIVFSNTSYHMRNNSPNKVFYNIAIVSYVLIMFFIEIYLPFKETVLSPIFENNSFINNIF